MSIVRPLLFTRLMVSPLFDSTPVNGPSAPGIEPGVFATTRSAPPVITVPFGKVKAMPPASCQPDRSTDTPIMLCNSIHSAASPAGG